MEEVFSKGLIKELETEAEEVRGAETQKVETNCKRTQNLDFFNTAITSRGCPHFEEKVIKY